MVFVLDMKTVIACYIFTSALCTATLASLWTQDRERSPDIALWVSAYLLQFVALVLVMLRGIIPDAFSIVLANGCIMGGATMLFIGLERYMGKTGPRLHHWAILGVFVVVHAYYTYWQPSLAMRTVNASVVGLLVCAQGAWLMLHRVDPGQRRAAREAGLVLGLFALVSAARIVVILTEPGFGDFFKSSFLDAIGILAYQLLFIALTFSLFLLVNRGLLTALKADVSRRTEAEESLRQSREKFAVAFQNVPDAIMITRFSDGRIIEINDGWSRILGYSKDEALSKTTIDLRVWEASADRQRFIDHLDEHEQVSDFESMFRKKSGDLFPGAVAGEVIHVEGERCIMTVIHDATESKLAQERLLYLSDRDPLTGLLNYRAFFEAAAERLADSPETPAAIIFLDLDGLKQVNDDRGHPAGDRAIVTLAEVLRSGFRESDLVGRLGGDEFIVLVTLRERVTDEVLLTRFSTKLRDRNACGALPFEVAASVGVAWRGGDAPDLSSLVHLADARMYEAKRAQAAAR